MRSNTILVLILTTISAANGFSAAIWPNEPSGSTVITDFAFDAKDGNGWSKVCNGGAVVQDPAAPASPSNVLQYTWRHSQGYGDVSNTNYNISGGLSEMYFGYWWKPSNPFTGWSNGLAKVILFWNDLPYSARPGKFYFGMGGPQGGPYTLIGETNYSQNNCQLNSGYGDCPGSYRIRANVKNPTITLGQWHRVEIYAKVGTCDACNNGIFRVWLDGELCFDFRNFNFPGPFTNIMLTPVWDAYEGNFPNAVDHHWFDHARVSKPNGGATFVNAEKQFAFVGSPLSVEPKSQDVTFRMPNGGAYALTVFDLSGREMWRHSGNGAAVWNHAGKIKKGIYLVRADQSGKSLTTNYCHLR